MPSMSTSSPRAARARAAVSLMFFTNGVLLTSLLPRYPEIKAAFGLDNSQFGLLVIGFPVGAIAAAAFAGIFMRRWGTLRVTAVGSGALAAALAVAGSSAHVWLFAVAMIVAGALDAVVDAAQNVHGVIVEQWRGRSIINSLHALWSVGAATGGVIGTACAAASISLSAQMIVNGLVWAAAAVTASALAVVPLEIRAGLRDDVSATASKPIPGVSARRRAWRLLVPFVVLASCGTLVEDVANNWAVLYLREETAAPTAIAGLGLTVMLGAQFVGRLLGDPMTDRWGRDRVAGHGGLLIALGATLTLIDASYPVALLGFALAGLGCATLVPAAFAAAGRIPGLPEGSAIAVISWLMRIGFLATSPVIGVLSDATSLRTAMVVPVAAGVVAAAIALRAARVAASRTPAAGWSAGLG